MHLMLLFLQHNCDICDEILPSDNSVTEIPCGHMFCNLCWERYNELLFDINGFVL